MVEGYRHRAEARNTKLIGLFEEQKRNGKTYHILCSSDIKATRK